MAGTIDPLFANHPFFAEQRRRAEEFKAEFIWNEIKDLEGAALDAKLREFGFDPNELLEDFDKAMAASLTSHKGTTK